MTASDIAIKELSEAGYQFERHGAKHDVYFNPELKRSIMVKRHKFTENTLRYIRQEIRRNQENKGR